MWKVFVEIIKLRNQKIKIRIARYIPTTFELVKYLMNLVLGGHHIGVLFKHIGDQGVVVIREYKLVFSLFQKLVA